MQSQGKTPPNLAFKAYQTAYEHGLSNEQIWLKSLQFIITKLQEAKSARQKGHFADAFNCHQKINRVLTVLQNALPDTSKIDITDPVYEAASTVEDIYQQIRTGMVIIASNKEDTDERYDALISEAQILSERLMAIPSNDPAEGG